MRVEVYHPDPRRLRDIEIAAGNVWSFDEWFWFESEKLKSSYAEGSLCGGETEKQFSDRLTKEIWRANRRYCHVVVSVTCCCRSDYLTIILLDSFTHLAT